MSAIIIQLPSLSPTMEVGTIAEWKVKEGDLIEEGTVIASIATDKSTVDYESLDEGYLRKIVLPEGGEAPVGKVIAVFTEEADEEFEVELEEALAAETVVEEVVEEDDTSEESSAPKAKAAPAATGGPVVASFVPAVDPPKTVAPPIGFVSDKSDIKVSPAAKKLAAARKINLSAVEPKTTGTRIVLEDIENLPNGFGMNEAQKGSGLVGYVNRAPDPTKDVNLSQMRKAITDRMIQASAGVPVFYLTTAVEMDKLLDIRQQLNSMEDTRISINDFIVKGVALALRQHPEMNAAYQGEYIRQFNDVDISVAVSIPDGLITPIVRSADTKGLAAIGKDVRQLVGKARAGALSLDEYQGGSFTISNLGMFGAVETFTAILNPPQAAILAVAGTSKQVKFVDGEVKEISVCKLTITCDHRVVDGALAAEFMNTLKNYLETPVKLVL
ncbi:MAG: 2-oxo acid dehydrogenase subunit E2 [Lentisphaeraceae bacterium]|nr:2-oxo acid dehydrogenase subunit E2 [Lentisphaeraceae bacterium]